MSDSRCESASTVGIVSSTQHLAKIIDTAAENSRKSSKISSNISQLRLSNMNLHGRDDELKLLRGKLRELAKKKGGEGDEQQQTSATNVILVSGKSGTGKSALINKGLAEPASRFGHTFAKGKFDQKLRRPLSAFSGAMENLCRCIQTNKSAASIREEIHNEFDGDGLGQLNRVIPGFAEFVGSSIIDKQFSSKKLLKLPSLAELDRDDASCSTLGNARRRHSIVIGEEAISRMHYAVRRLLKIICSHLKGVVLFIDDLQWSDKATLDMLNSIVLDKEIPSLLIVGAYRRDEVTDRLASCIEDIQKMDISVTKINVGNINTDNVTSFVTDALGMDENDSKVKELAVIIHKKTEGNPFFVAIFLTSLYDDKILQFNFGTMKWFWKIDDVESMVVTDNVANVLVKKLHRMKEESQRMLMVASCLGASFRMSAIVQIMNNMSDRELRSSMRKSSPCLPLMAGLDVRDSFTSQDGSCSSVASSIVESEVEGLIETDDNEICYFVHDQIQSAAFDLISPDQRDNFQGKIGSILLKNLSPEEVESNLFEVVGLLNCSSSQITEEESAQLAQLNLEAGKKASENGAFDTAKVYYKAGREALGSKGWEQHYDTMLDLCGDGANACYLTGDFETMNELMDEVLSRDIDTMDKYRITEVKVKSLHAQGKVNESIDAALEFRRQLGLPTQKRKPVSNFIVLREYLRVMRLLKGMTPEDIAALPELEDERQAIGQQMYELLATSINEVEPTMVPINVFLMVSTTLKYGLNPTSCFAFVCMGALLCGPFGKPQLGREMARAAELILKQPGMRQVTPKTILVAHTFCYFWTSPLQDTIAPLLEACKNGLAIGDSNSACNALAARCYHLYFVGRSLENIQQELEASIDVMTQLQQESALMRNTILLSAVRKLRNLDTKDDDQKLDSIASAASSSGNVNVTAFVNSIRLDIFLFFQEWEKALELVQEAGDVRLANMGLFISVRYTYLEALTYRKAVQLTFGAGARRKMKKRGKKSMKLINSWAKNGNVNVVHYLHILQAELAFLDGKMKKAEESFKAAISTSKSNGFLHDRALAHELSSTFYKAQGDEYWSNYHIECAKTCYKEWSCSRKVDQLNISL